ncbi:MAG: metal-sensing transcriptional repressor [Oscillospiraceae bacterium]
MSEEQCHKTKRRTDSEYRALFSRLNRIEGQVRGIANMLEKDAYCIDVLTQVSAVQAALGAFSKELLGNHIRSCVRDGIRAGDDDVVDELVAVVQKLIR